MRIVLGFLVVGYGLIQGMEYRFNKIAQIRSSTPVGGYGVLLFIGDTDHDGLNELIFWTNYYHDNDLRTTLPWEIWEYREGNEYELEYVGPSDTTQGFTPYWVGDIDKDGLSDMIGDYEYGHCRYGGVCFDSSKIAMLESPDFHSFPTQIVWGIKYEHADDPNLRWCAKPVIADIDRDGKNEYIFSGHYTDYIFVAKCIGDNEIELVDSSETTYGLGVHHTFGDFDMDGKYELAGTVGSLINVYENTDGYKFRCIWTDNLDSFGKDVFSSRDSDGDGKPEFFIGYYWAMGNTFWLYRWETNGDNSYKRMLIDSVWVNTWLPGRASACGDVDGDGVDEIVWSIGKKVFVYKSTGNDKYERVKEWITPNISSWNGPRVGIRVYDMNKNGYPEIIVSVQSDLEKVTKIFEIDTTCLSATSHLPISKPLNLSISPNPAKRVIDVRYEIPQRGPVSLRVYDAQGRLVRTLLTVRSQEHGVHKLRWKRIGIPSGVYFIRVEAGRFTETRKLILM